MSEWYLEGLDRIELDEYGQVLRNEPEVWADTPNCETSICVLSGGLPLHEVMANAALIVNAPRLYDALYNLYQQVKDDPRYSTEAALQALQLDI